MSHHMVNSRLVLLFVLAATIGCIPVTAQVVTVSGGGDNATFGFLDPEVPSDAMVVGEPLLDGALRFHFTATTGSDIQLVEASITDAMGANRMNQPGGWYNNTPIGVDFSPPRFFLIFPELEADAYVATTYLGTEAVGTNTLEFSNPSRPVTHLDSVDDGPVTDFIFASFALIPDENGEASALFRGRLQTSAQPTPIFDDFEYFFSLTDTVAVPEPAGAAALLFGLLGLVAIRRRNVA